MTGLFLALPLAFFAFSTTPDFNFDFDFDVPSAHDLVQTSSKMEIASDSNFSNQTTNFSAGQTVYVKVTSDVSGSTKKALNLRDNQYNLITSYGLSQISSNPFQFTANFQAPSSAGSYSLEANLETDGSVVNLVKTISVGNGGASSSNSVKIKNEINTSNENEVLGQSEEENWEEYVNQQNPEGTSQATETEGENKGLIGSIWQLVLVIFGAVF